MSDEHSTDAERREWIFIPYEYPCVDSELGDYIIGNIRKCYECNRYKHKSEMKTKTICKSCFIVINRWK